MIKLAVHVDPVLRGKQKHKNTAKKYKRNIAGVEISEALRCLMKTSDSDSDLDGALVDSHRTENRTGRREGVAYAKIDGKVTRFDVREQDPRPKHENVFFLVKIPSSCFAI